MDNFIRLVESVLEFEIDFNNASVSEHSKHSLAVEQEELKALWGKTKSAFEGIVSTEGIPPKEVAAIKKKHKLAYTSYVRCISAMADMAEKLTKTEKERERISTRTHHINLPPCDTDIFRGDYLSWPTFRDMFTAIYILNDSISSVQKLFHLNQKTQGEAKDIVSKCPLTNEGFSTAWKNLCERYENKRILVNTQLKILFSLNSVETECGSSLKKLQREINNCLSSLKSHQIDISNWDAIITYLCSTKLPECTLSLWEQTIENKTEISRWEDMDRFLSNRFQTLETISRLKDVKQVKTTKPQNAKDIPETPRKRLGAFQVSVAKPKCKMCQSSEHTLRLCPRFRDLTTAERLDFIKSKKGCLNCLSTAHTVSRCTSSYNCSTCHLRHHTLLHIPNFQPRAALRSSPNFSDGSPSTSRQAQLNSDRAMDPTIQHVNSCFANTNKGVLLGTARVHINHNGTIFSARALIDSGSECSFISETLQRRINLPAKKLHAQVSGINNSKSAQVKEACSILLSSPTDPLIKLKALVLVLPQLTGNLPTCNICAKTKQVFPDLALADKRFFMNEQVDLILGGEIYPQIILSGIKKNPSCTLLAQETIFGWIITGNADTPHPTTKILSFFNEITLERQLSAFWELEDVPRKKCMTEEEKYCEELYQRNTKRREDGKYIVSLPFKYEFPGIVQLGPSLKSAFSQFYRIETRLAKNPALQKEYNKVLSEYETLGHMAKLTCNIADDSNDNYFLPHHAVIKEESTSTKVRVVFNASSPTANGNSLNDVLHSGPVLQSDLPILILRWRLFKYVFNTDIEKMYRQIFVHDDHTKFQRIVYRDSANKPISLYELKTVTFGVNCAPYLAIRTLLQLAEDVESTNPIASNILRKCMYVDDVLAGGHNIEDAIIARNEISQALESAGFPLRKWTSNCVAVLKGIPKQHWLKQDFLEFEDTSTVKALGIRWNARSDYFYFTVKPIEHCETTTKRAILSAIAKLFDPLGWLAPIIIVAKILMQGVWLEGTDWDEPVSRTILDQWQNFRNDYPEINHIKIPRWVYYSPKDNMEIHGFCDASEKAYAATLYLRVQNKDGTSVSLLLAKTRVAPVKTISLPRLELCGAVLLAELVESITENLDLRQIKMSLWTDSTIVLAWIRKPPCSWSTFVAHRITKIVEKVGILNWHHVESASNPADLASRGLSAKELNNNSLWWNGPSWLQEDISKWPRQCNSYETEIEEKRVRAHATSVNSCITILDRFSNLPRALRVISYIMRFLKRTHPRNKTSFKANTFLISSEEIKETSSRLIIIYQKYFYKEEYVNLKAGKPVNNKSEILPLNPFIDSNEILRAGGRLGASLNLSYNERHPIVLPYDCKLSRLIVQFVHDVTLHGENQLMLRLIRTQYWIPRVKNMIRSIIHNCKICTIYKKQVQSQLMGNLPQERISFSRAFTVTGVDFAGPFEIRNFRGRGCRISKGYVCLFVCFSTKAIHLEATNDLSTPSFLAAFARFIARRGCPRKIHSDNGTNFVGASRSLRSEFKSFLQDARNSTLNKYNHQMLSWHFIPAGAPHMGGLWEAGVKSFKTHFKKIASGNRYTFEEFSTLLCRIESCLNSRPLSPSSNDPSDLEPLTPGHFLVGGHLLAPPEIEVNENPASIVNRWQKLKALHQGFCKRWKNEYLTELQKRTKWKHPQQNIKAGDLVVIKEDNLPPNEWRLGRILHLHPGSDNRVRVVDVMTERGQVTRPLVKLVLLPADIETPEPESITSNPAQTPPEITLTTQNCH